jgi:large subunit ribosomal protein L4
VEVAPVAEFNTYDVLKQRYLILTRESLATLRERVKDQPRRRPEPEAAPAAG